MRSAALTFFLRVAANVWRAGGSDSRKRSDPSRMRGRVAGGAPFETVLIFRVAAPSRFFEGAEVLTFLLCVCSSADGVNLDQSVLEI
jgi:hypothetical protein